MNPSTSSTRSCLSIKRRRLNKIKKRRIERQNYLVNHDLPVVRLTKTNRHLYVSISYQKKTIIRRSTRMIKEPFHFMKKVEMLPRIMWEELKRKMDVTKWKKFHYHRGSSSFNLTLATFVNNFAKN